MKISEALAALHRQQIVHKNLRPWHILHSRDSGTVLFTAPGVETVRGRAFPDRSAGHVAEDAPAYMSPEQLGRLSRVVDGRSDLYSLGVPWRTRCCTRNAAGPNRRCASPRKNIGLSFSTAARR